MGEKTSLKQRKVSIGAIQAAIKVNAQEFATRWISHVHSEAIPDLRLACHYVEQWACSSKIHEVRLGEIRRLADGVLKREIDEQGQ